MYNMNGKILRPEVSETNFAGVLRLAGNPVNTSFDHALTIVLKKYLKRGSNS